MLGFVDILLENNLLIINKDYLIRLQPYHARQIDKAANISVAIKTYNQPFEILRIGDSITDELRIPKDFRQKVMKIETLFKFYRGKRPAIVLVFGLSYKLFRHVLHQ